MTTDVTKLLILDLDETLIHATETPLPRPTDFQVGPFHVLKRPHLETFLQYCLTRFQVAVWTSASPDYADAIVAAIFPDPVTLAFVWASDRCTQILVPEWNKYVLLKNLAKVKRKGYSLGSVVVIDDSPEKHSRNYGNLIQISPFTGQDYDTDLLLLMRYLEHLRPVPDIRTLDKRFWRRFRSLSDAS